MLKAKAGQESLLPSAKGSPTNSQHTLPIFNVPELRNDLDKYLDIVTDYTTQTKENIRKMERSRVTIQPSRFKSLTGNPSVADYRFSAGSLQQSDSVFVTQPSYRLPQIKTR